MRLLYLSEQQQHLPNFDIRANTHYRLDIMIRGDAEVEAAEFA